MKKIFLLILICWITGSSKAQQLLDDFDGVRLLSFGYSTGVIDTAFSNPAPDVVDSSALCLKLIRDTATYDFIRMYTSSKLADVSPYASNNFSAPRMKVKVYTSAPVGTPVFLQLGTSINDAYPAGIHSEYQAFTTAVNAWQILTFVFVQQPAGSMVSATDVDKIVLLFNPGSHGNDVVYFDDITGPPMFTAGVKENSAPALKLFQNSPNPAKEFTHITFQVNSAGPVTLKLYDMLGNRVMTIVDGEMRPGIYSMPLNTTEIPDGIYFYVLKKGEQSRSMKMIISK